MRNIEPISSDFQVSFLYQRNNVSASEDHHFRVGIRNTNTNRIQFGKAKGSGNFWTESLYPETTTLPLPINPNETCLLLIRYAKLASDFLHRVSLWINPTDPTNLSGHNYSKSFSASGGEAWHIATYDTFFGANAVVYDEFRIGTEPKDVLPGLVPEVDCCDELARKVETLECRIAALEVQLLELTELVGEIDDDFSNHVHDKGSRGRYTNEPIVRSFDHGKSPGRYAGVR